MAPTKAATNSKVDTTQHTQNAQYEKPLQVSYKTAQKTVLPAQRTVHKVYRAEAKHAKAKLAYDELCKKDARARHEAITTARKAERAAAYLQSVQLGVPYDPTALNNLPAIHYTTDPTLQNELNRARSAFDKAPKPSRPSELIGATFHIRPTQAGSVNWHPRRGAVLALLFALLTLTALACDVVVAQSPFEHNFYSGLAAGLFFLALAASVYTRSQKARLSALFHLPAYYANACDLLAELNAAKGKYKRQRRALLTLIKRPPKKAKRHTNWAAQVQSTAIEASRLHKLQQENTHKTHKNVATILRDYEILDAQLQLARKGCYNTPQAQELDEKRALLAAHLRNEDITALKTGTPVKVLRPLLKDAARLFTAIAPPSPKVTYAAIRRHKNKPRTSETSEPVYA